VKGNGRDLFIVTISAFSQATGKIANISLRIIIFVSRIKPGAPQLHDREVSLCEEQER
jgi:hypothetical protein